ncbi:MAG TPA: alcohol dehydrogenase catalytic domain-containing protein [Ktedonobacterales bacterium]
MRAVIFHQHDDVRVEEVPVPAIGPGELLLRVAGCGLCGSDILKLAPGTRPPVALGHELTGTVETSQTERFAPGQRVVVAHHVPCGACAYCRRGSPTMCAQFKATNLDPCGLAEFVRVSAAHSAHTTFALPDSLSDEAASFTEPLACCLRALDRATLATVEDAVIVGLGAMGLLLLQALHARLPAARVWGVDPLAPRRALARELGAADAYASDADLPERIRGTTEERGADLVILTVGARPALATAQALVRDGGEILIFAAQPGNPVPFDLWDCYHRELRLTSIYSSTPADLAAALALLAAGQVDPAPLISHRLPLAAFHEGVALVRAHQALKVYFVMGQ